MNKLIGLLVLFAAASAHAQSGLPPMPDTEPSAAETPDKLEEDVGPKDPRTATMLSLGGSLIASVSALSEDNVSPNGTNFASVGSAIYDTATAGSTARRYNREHRSRLTIVPTMGRENHATTTGLALAGSW